MQLNPVQGFRGVTKAFMNPWILVRQTGLAHMNGLTKQKRKVAEVARQTAEILEKATESDIKKIVEVRNCYPPKFPMVRCTKFISRT